MADWLPELRSGYDRATIRTIQLAFALSLLLHLAVLWPWLPQPHFLSSENPERANASGPLIVQLAPRPSRATPPPAPPPAPQAQVQPAPKKPPPSKPAPPRRPSPPPVVALNKPSSALVVPPPPQTPPTTPAPLDLRIPSIQSDFSSFLEARRGVRGETPPVLSQSGAPSAQPEEDENERHNRIVAENLGLQRTPTFGYDPKAGGGIFRIAHLNYDDAELIFFGWNRTIRRNTRQTIEIERGDASDIRIAVVRKVIAIIRERESGDFVWVSHRLGRDVTLSARPGDNAGLEEFLMRDFFFDETRVN